MSVKTMVAVSDIGNRVVLVIDGVVRETDLKENEILVEIENYNDFISPKWDGEQWTEGATDEEIEAEENIPNPPTDKERIEALEKALLEMVMSNG